jgi:Mn2+/Fe2+ NRAMP family transporter
MFERLKNVGPGAMVAAAFIGPGTITTATIAGNSFGYTLLWAVLFSVVATLVLQEMTARLGISTQNGLGHAIRRKVSHPTGKLFMALLVIAAILVGNAAYEAGNITGAVLGFSHKYQQSIVNPWILLIGIVAFLLLWSGKYRIIERSLVLLVGIMGVVFLVSALSLKPNLLGILRGLFIPHLPEGSLIMVVSLIGTTVVPYNLFLHASSVKNRWAEDQLATARSDTLISVMGGGIITMGILITAAVAFEGSSREINNINDLATQLSPLLGSWSSTFMSVGFLAAGLSSAITAPLAAAYATSEVLGWKSNLQSSNFRFIWGLVLLAGIVFSSLGIKPTLVILFAQFANGLLLPVMAIFLVWVMNDRQIMGPHVNNLRTNILGAAVIMVAIILGFRSIGTVLGFGL